MVAAMGDRPDTQRMVGDLMRLGTISSVDHAKGTCRVRVGEITTGDLPWLAGRAGTTRSWSPPSEGEQVMLLCPEADAAAGLVLPGVYSDAHPGPFTSGDQHGTAYADGAEVSYDAAAHALVARLPAGATVHLEADGGITIKGDVTIEGKLTASDDVLAGAISLKDHRHDKVQAGTALSGKPQ